MFFILVFLIGVGITYLFIRAKSKWGKWVPSIIFLLTTLAIGVKALFFPAPEMAVLGEIMYFMIFGAMTIGSFIGGIIIHFWKNKR